MPFMRSLAARLAVAVAVVAVSSLAQAQAQAQGKAAQANPAAEHLTAARAALNKVLNSPAPSGDAFKKLSEIKTEYIALEKAASTASPAWKTHYETISRLLTDLVGAPTAAELGAVGTSGRAEPPMAVALTANLLDFRTHLTAFSTAMGNAAPAAGTAAAAPAPAAPPAAAAPPATEPPPSAPPASAPPVTAPPASAPPATEPPPSAPPATAPPATAAAPAADATVVAQLDNVIGMVDGVLKANAAQSSGTVSIDRTMLEQIKTQLEQVKASLKKQ